MVSRSLTWLSLIVVLVHGGCGDGGVGGSPVSPAQQWREAQELWRRRDTRAFDSWQAVDPGSPEGQEARRLLAQADERYRDGVRRLREDEAGAREALLEGVRIAPMDPSLYLPMARACRDRGLEARATEYYLKYLAARPEEEDARIARDELRALDPELSGVFDPVSATPAVSRRAGEGQEADETPWVWMVGAALALALVIGLLLLRLRRRAPGLAQLAERSPELHPAIAYLVGSLRHELLKHRIGAVQDALTALSRGDASEEQLAFLRHRLYGNEPIIETWEGHLRAFDRALGFQADLRRDPWFRGAAAAVRRIASLEAPMLRGDTTVADRLARAHETLRAFDAQLAVMVAKLVRARIDADLLSEVVSEVRSEYLPSQVELDELRIDSVPDDVVVEVFRVDLVLILKNIVRNAILAVGRGAPPRRIALDALVDLEPTGEEIVRIRVRDTSDESLSARAIYDRRVDRGLGLVTAALTRYDGAIDVEPGTEGYAKAIVVRFFRADSLPEVAT